MLLNELMCDEHIEEGTKGSELETYSLWAELAILQPIIKVIGQISGRDMTDPCSSQEEQKCI